MAGHVFISHSTRDDPLVAQLRDALEQLGYATWTDSRALTGGDQLDPAIRQAIDDAAHVVALLSVHAVNAPWVSKEIALGLEVAAAREGFKVIPILVPPLEPASLRHFFDEEPVALRFDPEREQLSDLLVSLRAALGDSLPSDPEPTEQPAAAPLAELTVDLMQLAVETIDGERRAEALARLIWRRPGAEAVSSRQFAVRAPIGPIEAGELAWYLERYAIWPGAQFQQRKQAVEDDLGRWGRLLFAILDTDSTRKIWEAFRHAPDDVERCVSIHVDPEPPAGVDAEAEALAREAATLWLGLPWELLRDDQGLLAEGARGTRVRRRLPSDREKPPLVTSTPIRVLVVSPRPEDEHAAYIDHRISSRPLVAAFARLGKRAEVTLLGEPTLSGLSAALRQAHDAEQPFHAVHFDGHGVYDRQQGLGALCFEHPEDQAKLAGRRTQIVDAKKLAAALRDHRVPLVVLEACQSAQSATDPMTSVAGRLLGGGVASVVAMSHSVLVATARRFVEVFYGRLSAGGTIGKALLAAQRGLRENPSRGRTFHGELELHDWFVPVLYQEQRDPQLVYEVPGERAQEEIERLGEKAIEGLPAGPEHDFVGRSRELLAVERLLVNQRYAVLLGEGGEGKTTLAVELARWLVQSGRFCKAAFVSVEDSLVHSARAILSRLGGQLVPSFDTASGGDFDRGWQLVERALRDRPTMVVLDNLESLLGGAGLGESPDEPEVLAEVLKLVEDCSKVGATRIVFTSRSPLPAPFARHVLRIGRLEEKEAIEMVGKVLVAQGAQPAGEESGGESKEDVKQLVGAAGCHARSLVLLAREVAATGVRGAAERMGALMATMAERHPDDRERSLFASVELSLRRLPPEIRAKLGPLGVFHGGASLGVVPGVLGLDPSPDAIRGFAKQLVDVGLAEMMPYGHLRLHPALAPALLLELGEAEREEARAAWLAAMRQLTDFLYQQQFKDAQRAAVLTLLELPNLLPALDALESSAAAEEVVGMATSLEGLLQRLGRPRALARVVRVRESASKSLEAVGGWSNARFEAESAAIDRLLDAGRPAEAVKRAQALVVRASVAGESAYPGAAYDLAMASFKLGRASRMNCDWDAALTSVREARERFDRLVAAGNVDAERMASACLTERGDCLTDLGRPDQAAAAYERAIELAGKVRDPRQVAAAKGQLGTVRMLQQRHTEALAAWTEARQIFEQLGEPGSVATAWHQIGMVQQEAGRLEVAEQAYQQSLALEVQRGDRAGEAATLIQLGNLYGAMRRPEEAMRFYRDATTIFAELGDGKNEGWARNNVAMALVKLERHAEARQELLRGIECMEPLGPAAEPWKAFDILHDLEHALGQPGAAAQARQQAIDAFLAYRRAGGENHTPAGRLVAGVGEAIAVDEVAAMAATLEELAGRDGLAAYLQVLIPALQAILAGSRDPAMASDPAQHYQSAVELRLLLEGLVS